MTNAGCSPSPWMRRIASLVAFSFICTFVLPLQAIAEGQNVKRSIPRAIPYFAPKAKPRLIPPPKSLLENAKPLTKQQISLLNRNNKSTVSHLSIIDSVGHPLRRVSTSEFKQWQNRLKSHSLPVIESAHLNLLIGETLLARDEQPEEARAYFSKVTKIATKFTNSHTSTKISHDSDLKAIQGIAAYDNSLALFYAGRYAESAEAMKHLLTAKPALVGFSRSEASLFAKHAGACAGYHAERAKMGIVEPTHLEPLCGIEAIASRLQSLHRPYDKKNVLPYCRYTGEGSNLQDLVDAAKRLKLTPNIFKADDEGLKALPKPLVAFCEHDHFISVVGADSKGVSYLCADCGAWPGGKQTVTWKQWHKMECGPYLTLTVPGSDEDEGLTLAISAQPITNQSRISLADLGERSLAGSVRLAGAQGQFLSAAARLSSRLKGHAVLTNGSAWAVVCGGKAEATHCPCQTSCPTDASGRSGGSNNTSDLHVANGASQGDPVNLATGEEEYAPPTDLSVYNPIGPSVSISRIYNSLRGPDETYQSDDFGIGWSHPYNYMIYDPTVNVNARVQQGSSNNLYPSGIDSPGSGLSWDIVQNGTTIATSSSPGSWSVSGYYYMSLTVPSNATVGLNYEARIKVQGQGNSFKSVFFDVYATTTTPQVPQGGMAQFQFTGYDAPASGVTWDVVQGGTSIATSANPKGWNVGYNGVTAPPLAPIGTYEARYKLSGYSNVSSNFVVYAVLYQPKAGIRYLIEPNGARIAITASSVPTASNPSVACSVTNGVPLLVTWNYASGYLCGTYTITGADRSQMITTTAAKAVGTTAILLCLSKIVDRNGNALNFLYGGAGTGKFPMLNSITDTNNSALVTFSHDISTGNITAVNDRYNRSIYYHTGTYANANIPSGWTQSYQEIDHVSQIVTTGTTTPPDRYAYGYQDVNNGENNEQVVFLHTITVPSPTGTGNATATINYAMDGTGYVTSVVDANSNSRIYTVTDATHTKVTVKDPSNNVVYAYTANFDANMSGVSTTNGSNVIQATNSFSDANDPFRPSSATDANNRTSSFSWDQYGNCVSMLSSRGITTSYTIDYSHFALGELTQVQQGSKTATSMTYYQPSGLIHTIASPVPGTSGGGTVTSSFTYDSLGNLLTETGPGNNAVSTITKTFNYTTDGSYSQSAAIMQPIAISDNLGHVTHVRYDSRSNRVAVIDALNHETDLSYSLANQNTGIQFAATGETGTGHATFSNTYQYVGGIKTAESQANESNTQVFQIAYSYGPEGEELTRTGSTQPYSASYDALYRAVSVSDGNSHATQLYYNSAGYAWKTVFPNGDTIQYTSFDNLGNPLSRTDGRNIVTNYSFSDAENKLTDVQYPASTSINVHLHYDNYGRMDSLTDGSGSHAFTFDDRDEKVTETTTYTGLSAQTLTTAY